MGICYSVPPSASKPTTSNQEKVTVPSARKPTMSYQEKETQLENLLERTQQLLKAVEENKNKIDASSDKIIILGKQKMTDEQEAEDLRQQGLLDESNKKADEAKSKEDEYNNEVAILEEFKETRDLLKAQNQSNRMEIELIKNQMTVIAPGLSLEMIDKYKRMKDAIIKQENDTDALLNSPSVKLHSKPKPNPHSAINALVAKRSSASQAYGNQKNFPQGQGDPQ